MSGGTAGLGDAPPATSADNAERSSCDTVVRDSVACDSVACDSVACDSVNCGSVAIHGDTLDAVRSGAVEGGAGGTPASVAVSSFVDSPAPAAAAIASTPGHGAGARDASIGGRGTGAPADDAGRHDNVSRLGVVPVPGSSTRHVHSLRRISKLSSLHFALRTPEETLAGENRATQDMYLRAPLRHAKASPVHGDAPGVTIEGLNVSIEAPTVSIEGLNVSIEGLNVSIEGQRACHDGPNTLSNGQNTQFNGQNSFPDSSAKSPGSNEAPGDALSVGSMQSVGSSHHSSSADEDVDYSQLDRYGFIVAPRNAVQGTPDGGEDPRVLEEGNRRARTEARRALKWLDMLRVLEASGRPPVAWPGVHAAFARRVVKGVPDCLRARVWSLFVEGPLADEATRPAARADFHALYGRVSGFERQIDLDIERTLRDHVLFRVRFSQAQVSLFKVLVAYANADPGVGYCQGMSTVAAFALLYYAEDAAFRFFARLMARGGLRGLYAAGFPLLFETFAVHEALMARYVPRVKRRLDALGIAPSVYATKWYMTLYLSCLPFGTAARVWDLFLLWGPDVLVCTAIALLHIHGPRILRLDYEPCMAALGRLPESPGDEDRFVLAVHSVWRAVHRDLGAHAFTTLREQYGKSRSDA